VVNALLKPYVERVEALLTEAQKQVLYDYVTCLIPPRNLRDPVRVGQATDHEAQVRALRQIRAIPALAYANRKGVIAEEALRRIEEHGGVYPPEERAQVKARLVAFFDRVRALSDVEFELNKEELAEELERFNRREQLKAALEQRQDRREVIRRKIRLHLLHPRIVALLEARLQQQEQFQLPPPADLASLPGANQPKCPNPDASSDSPLATIQP
jgi:hypothetical protein